MHPEMPASKMRFMSPLQLRAFARVQCEIARLAGTAADPQLLFSSMRLVTGLFIDYNDIYNEAGLIQLRFATRRWTDAGNAGAVLGGIASGVARQCELHEHEEEILACARELVADPANFEKLQADKQPPRTVSKQALGPMVCERLKDLAWFPFKDPMEIAKECASEGNGRMHTFLRDRRVWELLPPTLDVELSRMRNDMARERYVELAALPNFEARHQAMLRWMAERSAEQSAAAPENALLAAVAHRAAAVRAHPPPGYLTAIGTSYRNAKAAAKKVK